MTRRLNEEESALWDALRKSVEPLKRRRVRAPKESAAKAPGEDAASGEVGAPAGAGRKIPARKAPAARAPAPPPATIASLASLDEKMLRRLGRGLVAIAARIDLHGMRQERAFSALTGFLRHQQGLGARVVLVVTGKGREERGGVLRESVPLWLARPDLRALVVGYSVAGRRHGGAGALYVRIRRRREAGRPAGRAE